MDSSVVRTGRQAPAHGGAKAASVVAILDRAVVGGLGVKGDAGEQHRQRHAFQIGGMGHDIGARLSPPDGIATSQCQPLDASLQLLVPAMLHGSRRKRRPW